MNEVLNELWQFVSGVCISAWELVSAVVVWVSSVFCYMHENHPLLQGLLIGVALTWLLLRRDNHPVLRVLSSPLKLVVDILDLAWEQVSEVVADSWGTLRGWVSSAWSWCCGSVLSVWNFGFGLVRRSYTWLIDGLKSVKESLSKKDTGE